jgi:hypothetical protein
MKTMRLEFPIAVMCSGLLPIPQTPNYGGPFVLAREFFAARSLVKKLACP